MFTGIVQSIQKVTSIVSLNDGGIQFAIDYPTSINEGNSVALNGVCLTVIKFDEQGLWFDAIEETLMRSNLNELKLGTPLNCERAARFGDEIGGHYVSGHVICTLPIISILKNKFSFSVPSEYRKYLFEKGYVALNGVSLTIVSMDQHSGELTVHLIPETLKRTLFGFSKVNQRVNLEIDSLTQATVDRFEAICHDWYNT